MDYKYFVKSEEYKDIPDGVVIILMPKEKKFIWFYYRAPQKKWYGDAIDFTGLKETDEEAFEKEALDIILKQVNETIAKLDEKVN